MSCINGAVIAELAKAVVDAEESRDNWKRRALEAERAAKVSDEMYEQAAKRAEEAEARLEHVGACGAHQEPCHQCWISAEAAAIARVVAMIRFRRWAVINWTSEDVSRLITDIERGEWRKDGSG